MERGTNRPRGFGYAELENTQALMEALSLSGEVCVCVCVCVGGGGGGGIETPVEF